MRNNILQVSKKPYREDSGLTFWVYKPARFDLSNPPTEGYEYIEHYEKLSFLDRENVGSLVRYLITDETEHVVFYEIDGDYIPGTLTRIADDVSLGTNDYQEQLERFIHQARNELRLNKLD